MTNEQIKTLALDLAMADTEDQAVQILTDRGLWDDETAWTSYGDNDNNLSIIYNQQSEPENALVEKLINSVDAVLMRECLERNIVPDSDAAPKSVAEAQKDFFGIYNGKLSGVDSKIRSELSNNIMLVATGSKRSPNYSIIDKGEGQTPENLPKTLLSLTKGNKNKIRFVQGKYGMGGSGALRHGSPKHKLQLVISKRNTKITDKSPWGVTVIRREEPPTDDDTWSYKYLTPNKKILSFESVGLPLLPMRYPEAFGGLLESGTYIKMYEYKLRRSSLATRDLHESLTPLLPGIALPVRIFERRKGFSSDSFGSILVGIDVILDENDKFLEEGFKTPSTGNITVQGQKLNYSMYVFKLGKERNLRSIPRGVIFSVNGQTHATLREGDRGFFSRKAVDMGYLAKSILMVVDCSNIQRAVHEELFMASRDRFASKSNPFRIDLERELERIINQDQGLRNLNARRREEQIKDKMEDDKPSQEVFADLIKLSPAASNFLSSKGTIKSAILSKFGGQKKFKGKRFPSFFEIDKERSRSKPKQCPINNQRFEIYYNTDVNNDYFNRGKDPGELILKRSGNAVENYSNRLRDGKATLTVAVPSDVKVGDILHFEVSVSDISRVEPINSEFYVEVTKKQIPGGGGGGGRHKPPNPDEPNGTKKTNISFGMPKIIPVTEKDWEDDKYAEFNFDKYSALKVKFYEGKYDFFINMDNTYLKAEARNNNPLLTKGRYKNALFSLGISMLNFHIYPPKERKPNEDELPIEEQISRFTEAISPLILPTIAHLGDLDNLK